MKNFTEEARYLEYSCNVHLGEILNPFPTGFLPWVIKSDRAPRKKFESHGYFQI